MKLSVSLNEEDVAFLDEYAKRRGIPSRSAAVQQAVELLRLAQLEDAYADAWTEWQEGGEAEAWEPTVGDGLEAAGG
jgi:hypothetical protein